MGIERIIAWQIGLLPDRLIQLLLSKNLFRMSQQGLEDLKFLFPSRMDWSPEAISKVSGRRRMFLIKVSPAGLD